MRTSSGGTRNKDLGVIMALLDRLNTFRMPRALELQKRVEAGETLSTYDIQFLKQALNESGDARRLAERHPEYQSIVDKMTTLYTEIVQKAGENEKASGAKQTKDRH